MVTGHHVQGVWQWEGIFKFAGKLSQWLEISQINLMHLSISALNINMQIILYIQTYN